MIREHGPAIAYDLQAIGVDLRDLWRPGSRLTPRWVLMLVGQLPDTSAFAASVKGGPEFRAWSVTNSLLAANANLLHAANTQRAGKKSFKPLIAPPKKQAAKRVLRVADIKARQQKEQM